MASAAGPVEPEEARQQLSRCCLETFTRLTGGAALNHSFSKSDAGQRQPSLGGGPAADATHAERRKADETAGVRMLAPGAEQAQPRIAAQIQALARKTGLPEADRSPDAMSDGLGSRLHMQMLFSSGIASGQTLLQGGASSEAIAARVSRQVQTEVKTHRMEDNLPCWVSGLIHGLGGPEVAQRHVQAVLAALMRGPDLRPHVLQSCLHALALALSGKNDQPEVRIKYTPHGVQVQQDLSVPRGPGQASAHPQGPQGGSQALNTRDPRPRGPAWDTRLAALLGAPAPSNADQVAAWNNGLQGLNLDPLWRMHTRPQAPTLPGPVQPTIGRESGGANAGRPLTRRPASASQTPLSLHNAEPARNQAVIMAVPLGDPATTAELPADEPAPPESQAGGDAAPPVAARPGGDALPPDPPSGASPGVSTAQPAAPLAAQATASVRALALALRDQLQPVPELMMASADAIEAFLLPTRKALPEEAQRDSATALQTIHLDRIQSTGELRHLDALAQAWRDDLAELDQLVQDLGEPDVLPDKDAAYWTQCLAAIRQRLVTNGSVVHRLLQDRSATLKITGQPLKAIAQQPSLGVWLPQWIDQAYAQIPPAVLIERLIERTWPSLLATPPGASAPLPRPERVDDDGETLKRWFEAELQRRWAIENQAIDRAAEDLLVAGAQALGRPPEQAPASLTPKEITRQTLKKHLAARDRLDRVLREFKGQLAQLTDDHGEAHAIALGLTAPSDRSKPSGEASSAGTLGQPTFRDLADMLDLIEAHRERQAKSQPAGGSSLSPLASAPAAPAASPLPGAASLASEDADDSMESEDPDPPDDLGPFDLGPFGDSD